MELERYRLELEASQTREAELVVQLAKARGEAENARGEAEHAKGEAENARGEADETGGARENMLQTQLAQESQP